MINGIGGGNDGPHLDLETGELICNANDESPTSEYVSSSDTSETVNPTLPVDPTTDLEEGNESTSVESTTDYEGGNESTTSLAPDDETNSSNFLFHKFQMMFYSIATIMTLRTL